MKSPNNIWADLGELPDEEVILIMTKLFTIYEDALKNQPEDQETLNFFKKSFQLYINGGLSVGSSGSQFFLYHISQSFVNIFKSDYAHGCNFTAPKGIYALERDPTTC